MDAGSLSAIAAFALATATALWIDAAGERRGLLPPGFARPWRRAAGSVLLAFELALGVFLPAFAPGLETELDLEGLRAADLFLSQQMMLLALLLWLGLGYVGVRPAPRRSAATVEPTVEPVAEPADEPIAVSVERAEPGSLAADAAEGAAPLDHLGLRAERPLREVALGLLLGVGAWVAVALVVLAVALLLVAVGGEAMRRAIEQPAGAVVWMAGLPLGLKLALSLAAGTVEEVFFRGFLQRRLGLVASTVLFVLGHMAYGQPFMLVGVTVLSLLYGLLARWRGNVWAAMAAHTLFDAVQLTVVIPLVLEAAG